MITQWSVPNRCCADDELREKSEKYLDSPQDGDGFMEAAIAASAAHARVVVACDALAAALQA